MTHRFRKERRLKLPSLNFFAIPNIVLLLVFFFVASSHIRQGNSNTGVYMPLASELQHVDKRAHVTYITIKSNGAGQNIIFVDKNQVPLSMLTNVMKARRASLEPDERQYLVVSLRVDKDMTMGVISDVKQALRHAQVLNICYAAMPEQQ